MAIDPTELQPDPDDRDHGDLKQKDMDEAPPVEFEEDEDEH